MPVDKRPEPEAKLHALLAYIHKNFEHLDNQGEDLTAVVNALIDEFESSYEDLFELVGFQEHVHDGTDGSDTVDHGGLTGLGDDDHPQYLTPAEHTTIGDSSPHHAAATEGTGIDISGQAISVDLSELAAGGELAGTLDAPTVDATHSGSTHSTATDAHIADTTNVHDHGHLAGLSDDDHPQYATNAEFDDHSARHENGGADEISIAGLDGTPVELTNHLNDAADAHDASAVSFDPTGLDVVTATEVQTAIEELDAEFASVGGGGGSSMYAHWLGGW